MNTHAKSQAYVDDKRFRLEGSLSRVNRICMWVPLAQGFKVST